MKTQTKSFIDRYIDWLREESVETDLGDGWSSLTFPFLDRHNDYLEVLVADLESGFRITDEGRIIRDLRYSGIDLKKETKRRAIAEAVLDGLGLDSAVIDSEEITARADDTNFPKVLQSVLSAMQSLDCLANVSAANVARMFKEDIADWFSTLGVRFEPNPEILGESGIAHDFDFVIPGSEKRPPQIIQALAKPDKMHIQSFTFSVIDSRKSKDRSAIKYREAEYIAILNDRMKINKRNYKALLTNNIEPMKWTHREEHRLKFAS